MTMSRWHDNDPPCDEQKTRHKASPADEAAERLNEILRKAKADEKEAELARQLKERKGSR
jgi:hypothetical protein